MVLSKFQKKIPWYTMIIPVPNWKNTMIFWIAKIAEGTPARHEWSMQKNPEILVICLGCLQSWHPFFHPSNAWKWHFWHVFYTPQTSGNDIKMAKNGPKLSTMVGENFEIYMSYEPNFMKNLKTFILSL